MKSLHLDPDWLRQKYEVEGLSTYEIGALVGRDPTNIHDRLVAFGIPRRPKWARAVEIAKSGAPRSRGWKRTEEGRRQAIAAASRPQPKLRGEGNGMFGRKGALHHNFKGGSTPERQAVYASAEWAEINRVVLARDCYRCQRCGAGNRRKSHRGQSNFCLHHVKGWSEYPDLRLALDNIITLCKECHRWVHSNANVERALIG